MRTPRWDDAFPAFLKWVGDPDIAERLPPAPLTGLVASWDAWRGAQGLGEEYKLDNLAATATQTDRETLSWCPSSVSSEERRLIGVQLAQIPEFAGWHGLDPFRHGPLGVFLLHPGKPSPDDVKPIVAALVPLRPSSDHGPKVHALNFTPEFSKTLPTIGTATLCLLRWGLPSLVPGYLVGGTYWFCPCWLASAFAGLLWNGWFGSGLVAAAVLAGAVVLGSLSSWRWASLLCRSSVYLVIDRRRANQIIGESFGVPACLAIVVALAEILPRPRGVLGRLVRALNGADERRAYTGEVTGRGGVTKVEHVAEKIKAVVAARVSRLYIPAGNGRFQESQVHGVRWLWELAARLCWTSLWPGIITIPASAACFVAVWWSWPQEARILRIQTASGDPAVVRAPLGVEVFGVTVSGRAYHALELEVAPTEGAVSPKGAADSRGWEHSMSFKTRVPGTIWFLIRFDPLGPNNRARSIAIFLRDHRGRLLDERTWLPPVP